MGAETQVGGLEREGDFATPVFRQVCYNGFSRGKKEDQKRGVTEKKKR